MTHTDYKPSERALQLAARMVSHAAECDAAGKVGAADDFLVLARALAPGCEAELWARAERLKVVVTRQ